jgi:hypothetical protein
VNILVAGGSILTTPGWKEDLKKRIRAVVKTGIGAAADPIG